MTAVAVRMNGEIVVKMNLKKWRFVLIALLVIPLLLASILASANPLGPTTSLENESLATAPEEELVVKVDPVMELATTPVYDYVDDHISTAWGAVDSFTNMKSVSTAVAEFTEEHDGGNNYRFEAIFRFSNPRIHHYIHKDLQVRGKNRDWIGVAYEDLHAYWSYDQSSWNNIYWNPIVSGGVMQTLTAGIRVFSEGDIYVKLVGAIEEGWPGDWGCQNIWDIEFMRFKMENYMTERTLTCDALFDSDNLYAMRGSGTRNYAQFVITAYDEDGGGTIDGSELRMYIVNTAAANMQWSVAWTAAGGFTESDPNGYITLVSGSTAAYGFTMIITYRIEIEWDHPDLTNVIMSSWTFTGDIRGNILTPNWDVETRLTMQGTPAITSDRVNLGATAGYAGDVKYYGSAANIAPLASEVNVEVRRTSPTSTGWVYTDDPASDGTFTVNPSTDSSTAGSNLFELRVVADGDTTNLLTNIYSDTVIGDRVEVVSGSPGSVEYNSVYTGGVVNTGDADTLYFQLRWESDLSAITSGTVTWSSTHDAVSMSYDSGDTRWEGTTYARASYGAETYNTLSVSVDGVTAVKNEPLYSVAWDEIEILTTVIEGGDNHVNIGNSVTIRVTARLSHLGHNLDPGTDNLYMNGVKMSDGGAYFTHTISHLYAGQWTFSVDNTNALEKTYGISRIALEKPSVSCTWDTLMVELSVDDSRVNVDDTVRVWAHVTRAYDGSVMSSGTVILRHSTSGDISMIYSPVDEMWYADVAQTDVDQWIYYIYSISDLTSGLTTIGRGTHFDGANGYVNCGSDSSLDLTSSLSLSVWFYGDGSSWGSGMYLLAKKDDNNAQYALYIHSDGTLKFVYYNGTIREIDLRSGVTRNAWHHVVVTTSGTTLNCWYDGSHVQDDLTLPASLVSFSSVPLYFGAEKSGAGTGHHLAGFISEARVYNTVLSDVECEMLHLGQYPGTSNLRLLLDRTSFDAADGVWHDLSSSSNDGTLFQVVVTAGSIPMSSDEVVRPIWDQVKVLEYTSDNPVIDVDIASSCHVTLHYAFDDRLVEAGAVTVNEISAMYSDSGGVWDFSESKSSAQGVTYNSVSYSGGRYDLNSVDQNGPQTLEQVWEQILILTTTVVNGRINEGATAEVQVTARLTHYSTHYLGASDNLYMNGVQMSWSPSGYFYYRPSQSDWGTWNYQVDLTNAYEASYGISSINRDGHNVAVSWDALIISITDPLNQHINIGENATGIHISVVYALDSQSYDGTISLNDTTFTYSAFGKRGYSLLPFTGDDSYGITAIESSDETWCIWDSIIVSMTDPSPQTLLVGQNASGIVVSAYYEYGMVPFDGTVNLNDTSFEYHTEGRRGYMVSFVSGGVHGINVISVNDETYALWVRDTVSMTRFQYGYKDTASQHGVWTDDGNSSSHQLTGLTLFMTNAPVGLLEAAWADTDFGTTPVSVLRYPVFLFDYQFTQGNIHILASVQVTYMVGAQTHHLTLELIPGSNVLEIDLREYGVPLTAEVVALRVMLYEVIPSAESSTSSVSISEASLQDSIVTWSHDYRLDVRLLADGGSSTENILVNFYLYEDSAWTLIGSNTTSADGWANLYYNSRVETPGTTMELMVTWNAIDAGPYLQGEVLYGIERDYVDVVPFKVYSSDVVITPAASPIEYKEPLLATIDVVDQFGNPINESLGFAYRLECPKLNTVGDRGWGHWTSSDWHSLGLVLYPAGEDLTLVVAFQPSIYYQLVGSPSENLAVVKRELTASSLGPYILYLIHTDVGDTPALADIEFSDALKVVVMVYDPRRLEMVDEVVNVTYSYEGRTYWSLTLDGIASIVFDEVDTVGITMTATLTDFIGQNYTLVNDVPQARSIASIREGISYLSAVTDSRVGFNSMMPLYITAYDNDDEAIIGSLRIVINGTDIFNVDPFGQVDFTTTHLIALEGNLSLMISNGTAEYNSYSSSLSFFVSTGLRLVISDIENKVPIYRPVVVNVSMFYAWDNAPVQEGYFTINGTEHHLQDYFCEISYFAGLQPGNYSMILIPLNDSSTVLVTGPEHYWTFNWTACHVELMVILDDSYALDLVDAIFYLYSTDDSVIVPVAGFEVYVEVYHDSGTLGSGTILTNTSGYAALTFNLSLPADMSFYVDGYFTPSPPMNNATVSVSATTLARLTGAPSVTVETPKEILTESTVDWYFTDEANFTILVRELEGTILTVLVTCELYSGSTLLWSTTQSGLFEFSMVNIWGDNSSALDTFRFVFYIASPYYNSSWSFTLYTSLIMEEGQIIPEKDIYEVQSGEELNITALFIDTENQWLPGNSTSIAGETVDVPASLYVFRDERWELVVDDLIIHDGMIVYEWGWETLALPDGTYEFEFRYGGPGTGVREMSASFTVTIVSPPDVLFLTMVAGIVFFSAAGLAVTRKILRGRAASKPKPASPGLRKALEEERDSIPERVREHTERRMTELDEISHGAEETSELSSTAEPGIPPKTGTEGDSD